MVSSCSLSLSLSLYLWCASQHLGTNLLSLLLLGRIAVVGRLSSCASSGAPFPSGWKSYGVTCNIIQIIIISRGEG